MNRSATPSTGTDSGLRDQRGVADLGLQSRVRLEHARRRNLDSDQERPDDPGTEIEAYDGSFGRHSLEAETGGTLGAFDYFLSGNYFDETGWRDFGSSRVWQGFGKAGWQTQTTDLHLSYTYADDFLWGDGATPLSMLSYLREQTYTPDYTQNLLHFVNLTGTQILGDHLLLSGNAFYRYVSTSVLNGNVNDFYLEDNYAGPPTDCSDSGANPATLAYCAPGQDSTSTLTQRSKGFGLQLTDSARCSAGRTRASSVSTTTIPRTTSTS